ncbi:helix-turn-helix domain-containing protein [Sporosarcina sp. BI001-red]|uniref:helix-turn-helix domain-containing protein n=1 Tax=Sporosarcina sp. BI001-red TaxID=2282866 RepID=UPI00131451FF|nr:helix-turn-helix transcriptional regulator [Sporosarcina sp. BI001-red]
MISFGEQIRKLRKSKNLTLRGLADQSSLSYSFIGSLEKGRYNPSRESIYLLAKPLDTDVNELLKLAGFLPEQSEIVNDPQITSYAQHASTESFELEDILNIEVTFQGNRLKIADKIALISFLQTMSDMKNPR